MTTSNQQNDTESFFISDSLADRLSHWQADVTLSGSHEEPPSSPDDIILDNKNICHVFCGGNDYEYPILGWDGKENRIDLNVPYDHIEMFASSNDIKITFFKKNLDALFTSARFVENLWRVSIYFDDIYGYERKTIL